MVDMKAFKKMADIHRNIYGQLRLVRGGQTVSVYSQRCQGIHLPLLTFAERCPFPSTAISCR
jgi:hypothetical protein